MPLNLTVVVADDNTITGTAKDRTFVESLTDYATAPLAVTAESNEYVQKSTMGKAVLGWSALALLVGEKWGNSRGRSGSLPILRMPAAG